VRTAGSVTRHTLDAGRETITNTLRNDARAQGWSRETSASPCDLCSSLADSGVAGSEDSVDFVVHDHCGCSVVPIYL